MLNPKTNVCKLRNVVLLSLFACFQDGRQNHTESYIDVDSLFNVPRIICGGSVLVFPKIPQYPKNVLHYLYIKSKSI